MGQPFSLARLPSCEIGWARSGVNGPFTCGSSCTPRSNQPYSSVARPETTFTLFKLSICLGYEYRTTGLQDYRIEEVRLEPRATSEECEETDLGEVDLDEPVVLAVGIGVQESCAILVGQVADAL